MSSFALLSITQLWKYVTAFTPYASSLVLRTRPIPEIKNIKPSIP